MAHTQGHSRDLSASVAVHVCSVMSDSATPQTVACQTPLSRGFSRQEYFSGLPFLPPEDLPDPGIEPASSVLQAGSFPLSHLAAVKNQMRLRTPFS